MRSRTLSRALPLTLLVATSAAADGPAPVESEVQEQIVVTARRVEEIADRVPLAMDVVDGEELDSRRILDTRGLDTQVPSLFVADVGFNRPIYALRGIGFPETSQTAVSPVSVYLDEHVYPLDVMSTGLNTDMARVEVLKGPQGVLYGRNTTGGAINFVTRKPRDRLGAGGSVSYARFDQVDASGHVTGGIVDGVRGRLAGRSVTSTQGWQRSLTRPGDEMGESNRQILRALIDWDALDDLDVRLTAQAWRDHGDPQAAQPIAIDPQNPNGAAFLATDVANHPVVDQDSNSVRVGDWPSGYPWQLRNSAGLVALDINWLATDAVMLAGKVAQHHFDSDQSLLPQSGLSIINLESELDIQASATVGELRVLGMSEGPWRWQAGLHGSDDDLEHESLFLSDTISALFPAPGPGLPPGYATLLGPDTVIVPGKSVITDRFVTQARQRSSEHALLGSLQYALTSTITAALGARYTREERRYRGCTHDSPERSVGIGLAALISAVQVVRTAAGAPAPTDLAEGNTCATLDPATNNAQLYRDRLRDQSVSWRGSMDWMAADGALLYVSHSRGYKSGNYPILIASDASQLNPVTAERLDALELGTKIAPPNRWWSGRGALFHYDYRDKQLLSRTADPIFGTLARLRNVPKSRLYGAEAEVDVRTGDACKLQVSATFLDSRVKKFVGIAEDGVERDFAGSPFNLAPRWSAQGRVDCAHPVDRGLRVHGGVAAIYRSRTQTSLTAGDLFEHDPYTRLDASVGVEMLEHGLDLTLWAQNLTNAQITQGVFDPADTVVRYVGPPRTVGLTLTAHFEHF